MSEKKMSEDGTIWLHDINVILMDNFPSCRSQCPYEKDCGNHRTADEWRENFGCTPDLKQIVPGSWRCHKSPKETLMGAILADGTTKGSKAKGPDWYDDGSGYEGFYGFSGPCF